MFPVIFPTRNGIKDGFMLYIKGFFTTTNYNQVVHYLAVPDHQVWLFNSILVLIKNLPHLYWSWLYVDWSSVCRLSMYYVVDHVVVCSRLCNNKQGVSVHLIWRKMAFIPYLITALPSGEPKERVGFLKTWSNHWAWVVTGVLFGFKNAHCT